MYKDCPNCGSENAVTHSFHANSDFRCSFCRAEWTYGEWQHVD